MLILSLDRWPDGAVRIAWCGDGRDGRSGPEAGVQVMMVKPGCDSPFAGKAGAERLPYAVRDIAETVWLGESEAAQPAARLFADMTHGAGHGAGHGGGADAAHGAAHGGGAWWATVRSAAMARERAEARRAVRREARVEEGSGAGEAWVAPSSPRTLARLLDWLSSRISMHFPGRSSGSR